MQIFYFEFHGNNEIVRFLILKVSIFFGSDGQTDGRTVGRTDGPSDGRTDGRTEGRLSGRANGS